MMSKWRYRAMEITMALTLAVVVVYFAGNIQQRHRASVSPQRWLSVSSVYVPDHKRGGNPTITYDRTILEEFTGFWIVEVQRKTPEGLFTLECSGSGVNDYEPVDFIPNNQVSFEWFVGTRCKDIPAGEYRLRSSWTLKRLGWPEKSMIVYSNMFKVSAAATLKSEQSFSRA